MENTTSLGNEALACNPQRSAHTRKVISAAKAWRAACSLQLKANRRSVLGKYKSARLPGMPTQTDPTSVAAWVRRCQTVLTGHSESWSAVARKCHTQSCRLSEVTAMLQRRSQWLSLALHTTCARTQSNNRAAPKAPTTQARRRITPQRTPRNRHARYTLAWALLKTSEPAARWCCKGLVPRRRT